MHFIVTNNNKLGYHFCHCIQLLLFFDYLKHVKVTNMQEIRNQIGEIVFFSQHCMRSWQRLNTGKVYKPHFSYLRWILKRFVFLFTSPNSSFLLAGIGNKKNLSNHLKANQKLWIRPDLYTCELFRLIPHWCATHVFILKYKRFSVFFIENTHFSHSLIIFSAFQTLSFVEDGME